MGLTHEGELHSPLVGNNTQYTRMIAIKKDEDMKRRRIAFFVITILNLLWSVDA